MKKQDITHTIEEIDRTGLLFVGVFIGSLFGVAGLAILVLLLSLAGALFMLMLLKYYKNKLEKMK